jgi:hypothetical protein
MSRRLHKRQLGCLGDLVEFKQGVVMMTKVSYLFSVAFAISLHAFNATASTNGTYGAPSAAKEQLRQRLDFAGSMIAFPTEQRADTQAAFDPLAFVAILEESTGITGFNVTEESANEWAAETEHHAVRVWLKDMRVEMRDRRGYDAGLTRPANDVELLQQARELLAALGAFEEETAWCGLRNLVSSYKPKAQPEGPRTASDARPRWRATKVFCQRTVGGIPVDGDSMVASFASDGSLRKLLGKWRRIDYAHSQLTTTLTVEQFVEKALDALLAWGGGLESDRPIRLGTRYVAREVAIGLFVLELRGVAAIEIAGPGGAPRTTIYEFEI